MSALHYIVSVREAGFMGQWNNRAAFRWFEDAREFAERISKADNYERFVRVEREGSDPNYFRHGQPADHLFEEPAA